MLLAERWIIAALRHHKFYSLPELNEAIAELVEKLNQRPFWKREGSRASLFAELDGPAQLLLDHETAHPGPKHENLRGPHYYDPPTNLVQ